MFDPVSSALRAIAFHQAWAPLLCLGAGLVSCAGPCVAPRFIAVASLSAGKDPRAARRCTGTFICGLIAAYAAFGALAGLFAAAAQHSNAVYAILATVMLAGGIACLLRDPPSCSHGAGARAKSAGATLLLGASFAFVVSPCCMPMVAAVLAYASSSGDSLYGALLLASFGLGHAAPILAFGAGTQRISSLLSSRGCERAVQTAGGTLMLALAGYYAALA